MTLLWWTRSSRSETRFWSGTNVPVSLLESEHGWDKQQGRRKISSKFLTDIIFRRAADECDKQKERQQAQEVGVGTRKSTLSFPEDLCHISASNWWMQSCDVTDDSRYLPRMQKCNIMSDKLPHYLSAWNKRAAVIRNVMTTNCCAESMWHDAQFLMSCMADI